MAGQAYACPEAEEYSRLAGVHVARQCLSSADVLRVHALVQALGSFSLASTAAASLLVFTSTLLVVGLLYSLLAVSALGGEAEHCSLTACASDSRRLIVYACSCPFRCCALCAGLGHAGPGMHSWHCRYWARLGWVSF